MSIVCPVSTCNGGLHPRLSSDVQFMICPIQIRHSSHAPPGISRQFMNHIKFACTFCHRLSANSWCWYLDSDCQLSMFRLRSTSRTRSDISTLALSDTSLSGAPLFRMLSSRVFTNSLVEPIPYISTTWEILPTKTCALVWPPVPIAGVSAKIVSVATGSFLRSTL